MWNNCIMVVLLMNLLFEIYGLNLLILIGRLLMKCYRFLLLLVKCDWLLLLKWDWLHLLLLIKMYWFLLLRLIKHNWFLLLNLRILNLIMLRLLRSTEHILLRHPILILECNWLISIILIVSKTITLILISMIIVIWLQWLRLYTTHYFYK